MADGFPNFEFFDRPATAVETNLALMNDRADASLAIANTAIATLGAFVPQNDRPTPGNFAIPGIVIPSAVTPSQPSSDMFGQVDDPGEPPFDDLNAEAGVDDGLLLDPSPFQPTIGAPNFPTAPGAVDISGAPTAPAAATRPTIPGTPTLTVPGLPTITELNIPSFAAITDPTFTDSEPIYDGVTPARLAYTEPVYSSAILMATQAELLLLFAGGTGIPIAVQQALFDASRAREDQTALAARQDAFDTWAARGWSMPPGSLVELVSAADERSRLASAGLSRDILTKSATWEIENLRFAVTKGMELEGILITKFDHAAQRSFDAAKAQLDSDLKLLDVAVALYNVRQTARRINFEKFKTEWDGKIAKLNSQKAQIDGEIAKGQVNESRVKVYLGEWEGAKNAIDLFNGQMKGAQIEADIDRNIVEQYGIGVKAWSEVVQTRKIPFETWSEQMKGESMRAATAEAQARSFAETVRAQESVANVKLKFLDLKMSGLRASTEKYIARTGFLREHVAAQLANIQATAQAFTADTGRYTAEIQGENQARVNEIHVAELRLRNDIAYYETQLREFGAAQMRVLETSKIVLEAIKGAAQASTTLAAGINSAIHVQASMSGSGQVSSSTSTNITRAA
jgi:hypothetical protein